MADTTKEKVLLLAPELESKITNVAIHGKNIARTTLPTTSCLESRDKGASIPRATSLRRKPIAIAVTASLGNPKSPVTTGAVKLEIASNTPRTWRIFITRTAPKMMGMASFKKP